MATKNALDQAQQAVIIVAGLGALFVGYKVYRAATGAGKGVDLLGGNILPGAPAGVIPGNVADYTAKSGEQCHTDVGWFSQTQQCDALPEPPAVKAQGRSARIRWGIEHANEHTVLEALESPGGDLDAEAEAFYWAGKIWRDPKTETDAAPFGVKDYNPDFYRRRQDAGKILLWWGTNRATTKGPKEAAAAGDLITLQKYARGELL